MNINKAIVFSSQNWKPADLNISDIDILSV